MEILINYHGTSKLEKLKVGDWIDLKSADSVDISTGEFKIISLGVSMKLPEGYEAHIAPRSSTFKRWGVILVNGLGIIDNSYCGDNDIWKAPLYALRDSHISEGDRILQFRIVKKQPDFDFVEVNQLVDPDRGGIGSTGDK